MSNINSGANYRRISYTAGPLADTVNQVKEYIFFTIPDGYNAETVKTITINFGSDPNWRKLQVVSYGYSSVNHSELLGEVSQIEKSYVPNYTINQPPDGNGNVILNIDRKPSNGAKFFYIFIQTNKNEVIGSDFGKAEGFQIQSIKAKIEGVGTTSSSGAQGGDPIFVSASDTYTIFPSLADQPDVKIQQFWEKDIYPSVFYTNVINDQGVEVGRLESSVEGFALYTLDDDEFWKWNGSSWVNQDVKEGETTVALRTVDTTLTYDCYGVVSAVDNGKFVSLNATNEFNVLYDTDTIKSKNLSFQTINYDYIGTNYSESVSDFNLSSSEQKTKLKEITFNFSSPYSIAIVDNSSVQLSSVVTESGSSFANPSSAILTSYFGPSNPTTQDLIRFKLTTSAVFYSGSSVIVTDPKIINNYSMMTINRNLIPQKESVTALDGILLISDFSGKPIGIPKGTEINSYFGSSSLDEERDSRFGFIFLRNIYGSKEGFIYGFYDLKQKEFLGEKIAYVDLISRGVNNVYIGLVAFDSDGNSQNQIDFIGPKVSTTFISTDVPIKRVCPVYSVKFNSSSAIQVGSLNSFIDKKEAWPLMITSGSFTKKINIPYINIFKDWKANYLGQTLSATYDTSNASSVNWSNIFGRGYYDIINEKPIIISNKQIKLRQAPFLVWPEPSDYRLSKINLFIPQFEVLIKKSKNADWEKVNLSEIRDYNYNSGVIEFNKKIVPLNDEFIKVNYVKVSSDLAIYQSNGIPVPLNPFLNLELMKLNKPIYIYAMPTKINKLDIINISLETTNSIDSQETSDPFVAQTVPVTEYSNKYPINFTYNSQIFNKNSISYDPFALLIAMIYFIDNPKTKESILSDTRVRGGGIKSNYSLLDLEEDIPKAQSNWDIYPSHGTSYPKGGFVIVKLPEEVKTHFNSVEEVYNIVRSNLTAGVSFEIQNLDGEPWEI